MPPGALVSALALVVLFSSVARSEAPRSDAGNHKIHNFSEAKRWAREIHGVHAITIYCGCRYHGSVIDLKSCNYQVHKDARRAARLEWEHVVPAEAFGQSFAEWRVGSERCVRAKSGRVKQFKGRKCAETNPEFARMEADLYNLWPIIGELNGLRSNYSMAQISGESLSFGGCQAKIQNRKFEPMDEYKGIVARVYLYMDESYPGRGIISNKNRELMRIWDERFPVTSWECERANLIQARQGNANPILQERCAKRAAGK